ncbi:hypothetical protein Pd630_LPD07559 [Rhodococcus opacus PD630]|nr:hypothetical protein Pd630_LPD07559 [Rhodococcus opacus PD630]
MITAASRMCSRSAESDPDMLPSRDSTPESPNVVCSNIGAVGGAPAGAP